MENFLFKKTVTTGEVSNTIYNSSTYNIYCSDFPYKPYFDAKSLPSNDWSDEDGSDVYMPNTRYVKASSIDVTFVYKEDYQKTSGSSSAKTNITTFLDLLSGKDGKGSNLTIYDSYTKLGFQNVTFDSVSDEAFYKQNVNNDSIQELITFKVKFNLNDPTLTTLTLTESK